MRVFWKYFTNSFEGRHRLQLNGRITRPRLLCTWQLEERRHYDHLHPHASLSWVVRTGANHHFNAEEKWLIEIVAERRRVVSIWPSCSCIHSRQRKLSCERKCPAQPEFLACLIIIFVCLVIQIKCSSLHQKYAEFFQAHTIYPSLNTRHLIFQFILESKKWNI